MTAAERRLAEARAKQEQEEDMRLLKLSVQLEKEAAERARQERQMLLDLHQSRADKIAMLATIDKARKSYLLGSCIILEKFRHECHITACIELAVQAFHTAYVSL